MLKLGNMDAARVERLGALAERRLKAGMDQRAGVLCAFLR